jgi:putative transposase
MNEDSSLSKLNLRDLITPETINTRNPWILETPKAVREASVFEAYKNRKACFSNLKNKNIKHFELRFLSRKKSSWTIGGFEDVKKKSSNTLSIFPTYNIGHFKTKETIPDNFKTCNIHFDGLYYYIIMPVETSQQTFNNRNPCVSSDPGIRTFNTFYDGYEEKCYKVGNEASEIIYKDLITLDRLIAKKASKINNKSKKLIDKKIAKKRIRIQNLQSELHWKVSNWVCKKFDRVIIPKFESQKMCKKEFRKISTKTVRNMSVLSHGKFLERLKTKAEEFRSEIVIVKEDYTTMTCGKCYNRNLKIGSLEEWVCPKCKHYHDRDCNASRNILQKQL